RFDPAYVRAREAIRAMRELRFAQVTVLHPDDNAYRSHQAILPMRELPDASEAEINRATVEAIAADPYHALLDEIAGADAPLSVRVASFLLYDSLLHDLDLVRDALGDPV